MLQVKNTSKNIPNRTRQPGIGLEQTLKFSLGQAQAFEPLQEIFPSRLNVGGLLQELSGSLVTVRSGDVETFDEGHTNPTVPIQTSKQLLVNGHRDHVGKALI